MSAIATGCLAGLLCDRFSRTTTVSRRWLYAAEAAGWLLIAWIAAWPQWGVLHDVNRFLAKHDLDDTVLPLGACLVMVTTVLRRSRGGGRLTAPVRWFGRHSYEVYLIHEFLVILGVAGYMCWHVGRPGMWTVAITLLTAPMGWAVARWFSEPVNRRLREAKPPATIMTG
jgi:peptidoglycan/LPS O-acetylase OafA/YrhL